MIEDDEYCPKLLQIALAMKGHMEHVQGQVLESHLKTCASKNLGTAKEEQFIDELVKVIGLSTR
jgi:DNA-binding FrmR family transcriptional regulator